MGRAVLLSIFLFAACGDDTDDRCRVGARICRSNTVWLCGTDGVFSPERACADLNVCVDGVCTPPLQPDAVILDTTGDVEVIDTVEPLPDTNPDSTLEVVDTWVADTLTDTAVTGDDTRPPDTSADTQTPDTTPDTVPEDTTPATDTADTVDTTPDTTVDTTPEPPDTVGPTPEAPPGILGYTKVGNVALTDDLIRVAWDPSGDFAFILGTKGDVALFRPGQNLVKVGKVGSSPIDMVVVPTEVGVDLVILDTALGLLRTRLTESADALEPHVATTFPQGVARAIEAAPEGSPHFGSYAIATQQGSGPNTNYISYLYLWHPDTGLSPVKGFNASGGVADIMWGDPTIYAGEPWVLTTHGESGADSKSWIISTNTVVANNWSPGFGNAGFAAWRPDPTRASGLGTYGMVSGWSSNKLYVYDGAWRMAELPVPTGAAPQGIAWKSDGTRALIVGRVIGNPAYATVIEHRPTNAAWSASFVNQSITGFTSPPWSGNSSSQYLIDLAWRPNTACDEGLIVGADSGTSSPTFGFAIHFVDLDDPACR
ncbi:MAG TPA: hypothetical protein PK095_10195 [Myxococcota bacterium]|nr:hypothetical protein [Myxococcota bacterium]